MAKGLGQLTEKGYKTDKGNPQVRFYLGFEPKEAERRLANLEAFWEAVATKNSTLTISPKEVKWSAWSLKVAKCIAKGQAVDIGTDHPFGILDLFQNYPMVTWAVPDEVKEDMEGWATQLHIEADAYYLGQGQAGTATLYQAFDAFAEWIPTQARTCVPGTHNLKPSGKRIINNLKLLRKHHADRLLADFGSAQISEMENYWQGRPVVHRSGKMAAVDTCKDAIKNIRRFIRWLNKSSLPWRKPADYEVERSHIQVTDAEIAAKGPQQVKIFTIAEIKMLWEYANPRERFLMLLGLNCGFGRAEVGSLYLGEIVKGYIKRVRRKTGVYGEWVLWPETKKAIEWCKKQRAKSDRPELVLSRTGRPLSEPNEKGDMRSDLSATWYRLLDRVAKDHAEYGIGGARRLPFNKLRKTSGNWVRKIAGGETMKVFHARGKPVRGDEHSEVYSNRNFPRVHKAIKVIGRKLDFLKGEWPDKVPKPATSLGRVKRVQELRRQGYMIVKIAEMTELSRETVRKFIKQTPMPSLRD